MISLTTLLTMVHVIGLALAVGAATTKLVLLVRSRRKPALVQAFLATSGTITFLIILGLILLTLSGIGWILLGYPFSSDLIVKLCLVGVIWILGPVIDNAVEPKLKRLAPAAGAEASAEFVKVQNQYVALEVLATGLFYVIIVFWLRA